MFKYSESNQLCSDIRFKFTASTIFVCLLEHHLLSKTMSIIDGVFGVFYFLQGIAPTNLVDSYSIALNFEDPVRELINLLLTFDDIDGRNRRRRKKDN